MNAGMLIGSRGTLGPTLGFSILKVSKRATKQLTLIIIDTFGFHAGVAGIVAAASKIDEIKFFLLNKKLTIGRKSAFSKLHTDCLLCQPQRL